MNLAVNLFRICIFEILIGEPFHVLELQKQTSNYLITNEKAYSNYI